MENELLKRMIDYELLREEALDAYMDDDRDDPNFTVRDMEYELWSKGLRKYSLYPKQNKKSNKNKKQK